MKNLKIYSKKQMNPILKNLLRAAALLAGCSVEFCGFGKEACFVLDGEKYNSFPGKEEIRFEPFLETMEAFAAAEIREDSEIPAELLEFIVYLKQGKAEAIRSSGELGRILSFTRSSLSTFHAGSIPEDTRLQDFYRKWMDLYGGLYQFPITGKTEINAVNSGETKEYIKAFDRIKEMGEAPSIMNAIETLLDNIPPDTEKILDLGAGPGYVDEKIPEYYQVLAMDIDPEILRRNKRPSCLGDALSIPLEDQAVDMTVTCDMLEHIDNGSLDTVIRELKRVSAKYIYIQVPYRENLMAGTAYCPACGYEWHVNYHKNSFDEERLLPLLGEEWKAVRVNYTGEILYSDNLAADFLLLHRYGLSCNLAEGWKCPKCGVSSVKRNEKTLGMLHRTLESRQESFPHYSEIGVLYYKDEYAAVYQGPKLSDCRMETLNRKKIDFRFEHEAGKAFDVYDSRPSVFSACRYKRSDEKRYVFEKEESMEKEAVGFAFPIALQEKEYLVIGGRTKEKTLLTICGNTLLGEEIKLEETEVEAGSFHLEIKDLEDFCGCRIIKLYFNSSRIELEYAGFEGGEKELYRRVYFDSPQPMFHKEKDGIIYSYYKGDRPYLDAGRKAPAEASACPGSLQTIMNHLITRERLIDGLQKKIVGYRETAVPAHGEISAEANALQRLDTHILDESERMKQMEDLLGSKLIQQTEAHAEAEKKQVILNELMESFLAEQAKKQEDDAARQQALENLIVSQLAQNGPGSAGSSKGSWKRKARAVSDRIYIALMKTPLYEILVKLGAKKLYARIRNRRMRG